MGTDMIEDPLVRNDNSMSTDMIEDTLVRNDNRWVQTW